MRTRLRSADRPAEEPGKKTLGVREQARASTTTLAAVPTTVTSIDHPVNEEMDELALGVAPIDEAPQEEDDELAKEEEAETEAETETEDLGVNSEETMVRVEEPVTDEGSNHSDGESGPIIEFARNEEEEEEKEEEKEEKTVGIVHISSVGECKNQYAKALALIQEASDHSQVLALERYISQNIHSLKRGGDMESLFFSLSNVKLRDKVRVYSERFEQVLCPPHLKQDALLDLPILLHTYFSHQLNEERDGSSLERVLLCDTRTVLTSIAFHLAINLLIPQLDPRAMGQAKLKEKGMSRSSYIEQCKLFTEKVFDLFVDDEVFSTAFPDEPKECLRKLTTDLFAKHSDRCFDVPKLRKATDNHTPAKLVQLMSRYLDGNDDNDDGEEQMDDEEQQADEDHEEEESPARRHHHHSRGSPSAEDDATDAENASSSKGQAGMDEEDFGPDPSYQFNESDQEAQKGQSRGGKGRHLQRDSESDNDDDNDEDEDEDDDDDEKGPSSKRGPHKKTQKSSSNGNRAAAASETPVSGRRKRVRSDWKKIEIDALIKGIERYYCHPLKWAKIKKNKKLGAILSERTNGDLKDKFRSMRDSGLWDFSEFASYLDVTPKQNKRLRCGPN